MMTATFLALLPLACPQTAEAWSEDALYLVEELERLHPDPFFGCPRPDFEQGVDAFLGGLDGASDEQALVGLMRLFAHLSVRGRDGHSTVWPARAHYLPLEFYGFADGWFVVQADAPHGARVGAELVAIGGVPIEEACLRLTPLLTRDNDWNLRAKLARTLTCTEILAGSGLADDLGHVRVTLRQAGGQEDLVLESPVARFPGHHEGLPTRGGALWLEGREKAFHLRVLEAEHALYVQYNEVASQAADGRKLADFAQELVRVFEERKLDKVVIDVRSNGGGNNMTFGPLIAALQTPAVNRPGVLFALIGRGTFSAAGNFVTVLERDTKAILVGEPTGGAPNQFGDARDVTLPNHPEVLVRIATRYHQFAAPEDARLTHEPQLAVPLRSADYFSGRDPVLQAALAYQPPR